MGPFKDSAMVAGIFGIDPVLVMKSDFFDWAVRTEAARYYQEEMKKAQEKAESGR